MSRREKAQKIIEALVTEALVSFEEDPLMGEPMAVALSILWARAPSPPVDPTAATAVPDVTTTANAAVHKDCPLDPQSTFAMLSHALEGELVEEIVAPEDKPS